MGNIKLLNCDCLEYMATCKDKYFDLAITDPPYGINELAFRKESKTKAAKLKNYNKAVWNQEKPSAKYWNELYRISKNQIIWGGNYFGLPGSRCWIVWDKDTIETQWADAELAWTSFATSVRIFKFRWNGMLQQNMKDKEERIHPTQKPVQLYKWLLKNYATPDMKIIDTHLGSGSSAIAAYDFGCDFVGCEIDKEYYDSARKRFETYKLQQKLQFEQV